VGRPCRASVAPSPVIAGVAKALATAIVSRGLAGRAGSVVKSHAALLKLMEADSATSSVASAVLEGTESKKPKVPSECVKCITAAYAAFGATPMPNKLVLAKLKPLMEVSAPFFRAGLQCDCSPVL
jgi:hypothetical protein